MTAVSPQPDFTSSHPTLELPAERPHRVLGMQQRLILNQLRLKEDKKGARAGSDRISIGRKQPAEPFRELGAFSDLIRRAEQLFVLNRNDEAEPNVSKYEKERLYINFLRRDPTGVLSQLMWRYSDLLERQCCRKTSLLSDEKLQLIYQSINMLLEKTDWHEPLTANDGIELALSILENVSATAGLENGVHPICDVRIARSTLIVTNPVLATEMSVAALMSPIDSDPLFCWPAMQYASEDSQTIHLDARSICSLRKLRTSCIENTNLANYMGQILDLVLSNMYWQSKSPRNRYWFEQNSTGVWKDKLCTHETIFENPLLSSGAIACVTERLQPGSAKVLVYSGGGWLRSEQGVNHFSSIAELKDQLNAAVPAVLLSRAVPPVPRWLAVYDCDRSSTDHKYMILAGMHSRSQFSVRSLDELYTFMTSHLAV